MKRLIFPALIWLACAPLGSVAQAEEGDVIELKEFNFKVTNPNPTDWERMKIDKDQAKRGLKLHLQTAYADSDPPAACNVWIYVAKLHRSQARKKIEELGKTWATDIEAVIENKNYKKQETGKIGGVDCYDVDLVGTHAMTGGKYRMAWKLFRNGSMLYQYFIHRSGEAVEDEILDEELASISNSFKFFEILKVKADSKAKGAAGPNGPVGGSGVDESKIPKEKLERKEINLTFWKLKLVKPEGLVQTPTDKFDASEKKNGCVFKAESVRGQTRIMIRVYARSLKGDKKGVYTLDQLMNSYIKYFEQTYKKKRRIAPKITKKWKIPLVKKGVHIKLVGQRNTTEVTDWYLAECKNDRQYQVQIYYTGGTGAAIWKKVIEDFISNFKPVK